jgi:hypothetical protein
MAIEGVYPYNNVPLHATRGDTFSTRLEFSYGTFGSYHLDVSGSSFKMQVLDAAGQPVLSFTEGKGMEMLNQSSLRLYQPAVKMNFAGTYSYTLTQTLTDGTVNTLLKGNFIID